MASLGHDRLRKLRCFQLPSPTSSNRDVFRVKQDISILLVVHWCSALLTIVLMQCVCIVHVTTQTQEFEDWRLESPSGRDFFCLKNFYTFTRTSFHVSKIIAVARAQLTCQMLTLLKKKPKKQGNQHITIAYLDTRQLLYSSNSMKTWLICVTTRKRSVYSWLAFLILSCVYCHCSWRKPNCGTIMVTWNKMINMEVEHQVTWYLRNNGRVFHQDHVCLKCEINWDLWYRGEINFEVLIIETKPDILSFHRHGARKLRINCFTQIEDKTKIGPDLKLMPVELRSENRQLRISIWLSYTPIICGRLVAC